MSFHASFIITHWYPESVRSCVHSSSGLIRLFLCIIRSAYSSSLFLIDVLFLAYLFSSVKRHGFWPQLNWFNFISRFNVLISIIQFAFKTSLLFHCILDRIMFSASTPHLSHSLCRRTSLIDIGCFIFYYSLKQPGSLE